MRRERREQYAKTDGVAASGRSYKKAMMQGMADRSVCPTNDEDKQPIPVTLNEVKGLGCGQVS